MSEYEINSLDARIWEEELDDFVPPKVFEDMQRAFSKGAFFNRRVRDRYPASREP